MKNFCVGESIYVEGYDCWDLFKATVIENVDDKHIKIRYSNNGSVGIVEKDWGCYHSLKDYPEYLRSGAKEV